MEIFIDQSGKIEYTSKATVVAYANTKQKSLFINARDKRKIERIFREAGKPRMFVYKTFAALLYLLIRDDLAKIQSITIDLEYYGKEYLIKNFLLQIMRRQKKFIEKERISFKQVGKTHNCHKRAITVFRGKARPDLTVTAEDVLSFII